MKWLFAVIPIFIAGIAVFFISGQRNNTCKNFKDYYTNRDANPNCYYNPELDLTIPEIIKYQGYPLDIHEVVTNDNYILTILRIKHGRNSFVENKKPVLLFHGMSVNAGSFTTGGNKSLADNGYDVWLGNYRGTVFSKHSSLSKSHHQFWNFSINELVQYDLKSTIDTVYEATNKKLAFIGYSLSTATFLAYSATYPEHSVKRITVNVGLSPIFNFREWKSILSYIPWKYIKVLKKKQPGKLLQTLFKGLIDDVIPNYPLTLIPISLRRYLCLPYPFQIRICLGLYTLLSGYNDNQLDPEIIPKVIIHDPDLTSFKVVHHLLQFLMGNDGQWYDFGEEKNLKIYGSPSPIRINLSNMKIPTYFISAKNDFIGTPLNSQLNICLKMDKSDMLIWFFTIIIVVMGVIKHFNLIPRNNSCKTFDDYYTNRDKNPNCSYNPDYELKIPDIINRYGYPLETYNAYTDDHYILKIFRIPHGKHKAISKNQTVFLQHGLFVNCACFLLMGNQSLAFMLADAGYDVWLGNFRGTLFSTHASLSESDYEYWDFSLFEYAAYDLATMLDLVHETTQRKIIYVGYSFGATASLIYSSLYPEIAEQNLQILIHMGSYLNPLEWNFWSKHFMSAWKYVSPFWDFFTGGSFNLQKLTILSWYDLCLPYPIQMKICETHFSLAHDFYFKNGDPETIPGIIIKGVDSISSKAYKHFSQVVSRQVFRKYDYGSQQNQILYGVTDPTEFNITNIKVPSYFIHAKEDKISTQKNLNFVYDNLPEDMKPYPIYKIKDSSFTHGDVLWNKDVGIVINQPLITFLNDLN
ncbi:hypothetical protein FQR65_LT10748 [Abscondita terminalis]|nr:hypothetical protein FQR65_LT10748 [Abscondita terminalis]